LHLNIQNISKIIQNRFALKLSFFSKGPFIKDKDVCSQGDGGCPVRTFCRQGGGGLQMQMSTLFLSKILWNFSKFMMCPHGKGGGG